MISVTVERYPGDHPGPDIVDPMITSDAGARARANGEIDAQGYNALIVAANGPLLTDHIEPGALPEIIDTEQQAWRGQIERAAIAITKTGDTFTATQALEIEWCNV